MPYEHGSNSQWLWRYGVFKMFILKKTVSSLYSTVQFNKRSKWLPLAWLHILTHSPMESVILMRNCSIINTSCNRENSMKKFISGTHLVFTHHACHVILHEEI